MATLTTDQLKQIFVASMKAAWDFSYKDGNPFMIKLSNEKFFVYLKNLSPAFLKSSPDATRMQLKHHSAYNSVPKSVPIVVLGYDVKNEVFVSWPPNEIKRRVNARGNVSLYSRKSVQNSVRGKEIVEGRLSNGARFVAFKKNMLLDFFRDIEQIFIAEDTHTLPENLEDHNIEIGKLLKIEDRSMIKALTPMLKRNRVLEAATFCHKNYSSKYKGMKMRDWINAVNAMFVDLQKS